MDTELEEQVPVETETQDTNEQSDTAGLRLEVQELKGSLANLTGMLTQAFSRQSPDPVISDEVVQRFKDDPVALAKHVAQSVKQEVIADADKRYWDDKVEQDFKAIKTDPSFRQAVGEKVQELTSSGEYQKTSPKLVYRAAQLAAAAYNAKKPAGGQSVAKSGGINPVAPSAMGSSGARNKPLIAANDPRVEMAQNMGLSGAKLEKFKSTLPAYVAPEKARRGKVLSRG